jgi:hypothetical protein
MAAILSCPLERAASPAIPAPAAGAYRLRLERSAAEQPTMGDETMSSMRRIFAAVQRCCADQLGDTASIVTALGETEPC